MLRYRVVLGPIMIAAVIGLVYADAALERAGHLPAGLVMLAAVLVVIVLASRELCGLLRAKDIEADAIMIALAGCIGCALLYVIPRQSDAVQALAIVSTAAGGLLAASLLRHCRGRSAQGVIASMAATMFAFVYLGLLAGFVMVIRHDHGAWVVAVIILVTKCGDIGAYVTGRTLGRHKLIGWLSPGKTWEGLGGAVVLSALVAVAAAAWGNAAGFQWRVSPVSSHLPLSWAVLIGVMLALAGHGGDLIASALKRDADRKDTGGALPGFGGVIDIIDSPLAVGPVAYWLLQAA